ncbi:MAG: serine hydrolase [Anaerolineales bacterium]|uniref:serine hydrolase n=1 Tax=Candidatus Villigracilis vicinus TaxID=3140679 RepID=UPI0031347B90|nr:serine hydrolase [Anaerolineales bacterium]
MRNRNTNTILRGVSILFLIGAFVITVFSLIAYSRQRNTYPSGMTIAGVPVDGLAPAEASQRLLEVYTSPIEVKYNEAVFHIDPGAVGFTIDVETMLAAADLTRTGGSFWGGFWDYIWNRTPPESNIPLSATISEERLREFLQNEIASRYDTPPAPAQPIPGGTTFLPGAPGQTLDLDRALAIITTALRSPANRSVALTFNETIAARPTAENLEILLKQIVSTSEFDGLIGFYMMDLQTGQEIHFAMNNKQEVITEPDIAFTASSTIKLPILTSYLVNYGTNLDAQTTDAITRVFRVSDNSATDLILERIDPNNGPIIVTQNMDAIGLTSTYISGMFFLGAPNLIPGRVTPGNSRADIFTDPDPYSQTTPSEMGILLADIYQCVQNGGGALAAAFPDKVTPATCQLIIDFLALDKFGALIQGGVPDGTLVPHKHGFVLSRDGVMHDISDVGIIYSPGGNFVLSIYTYHPAQNIWDITNPLFVNLTQAVYNYFNISAQ